MQNWIKCSERMPENAVSVLIVVDGTVSNYTWWLEGDGWVSDGYTVTIDRVTHWQPLPEPPKE